MQPPPPQAQPQRSPLTLAAVQPARDEAVAARRPTIEAQFGAAMANPNSIRIELDGLNVTDQASRSPRGVVFSPPSDLQSGKHEVRIVGTDVDGRPFDGRWTFASGTSTVSNSITDVRPGNGASVHDQFTVSGHTMPGARVVVQVGTVDRPRTEMVIGQLFGGGAGNDNVRSEVTADGSGNFQAPITIPAHAGQGLTLVVDSTDAQTKSAAPRVVRNLTVE
jgi:methionine-rich copper-binding protein CopC